jgi:periplasmic protein TonB
MLKLICSALLVCVASTLVAQTDPTKKILSANADTTAAHDDANDKTFTKVEVESEFPGGARAWQQFLQQNLSYPKKAVKKNIQGEVMLQFIVGTDGTVSDIEAISGPEILRKEAVETMKKTPKWKPAFQNGRKVKAYKKQPIVFRLERE